MNTHGHNESLRAVSGNFDITAGGELRIGGLPVGDIAQRYGTPLFIYDAGILARRWEILRETYPPSFDIYYSVKANPNQAILRFFLARGCGLEIASGGELFQARAAGCSPEKMVFAGPGKTAAELELAIRTGVAEIHAESVRELNQINEISHRLQRTTPVALRVNPREDAQGGAMRMGGKPAPFGMDEAQLATVLPDLLRELSAIEFTGIHLYSGTQILDPAVLLHQYRRAAEIARQVAGMMPGPIRTVDFGGGLGIPYFSHEQPLDMTALKTGLAEFAAELNADPLLAGATLIIEPGRFLAGEAGVYVTRIVDIKTSRGKKFLITDGGMHQHLAASGNLGQTIKRNYPVALLGRLHHPPVESVDVVGPLCTPLDVLARNIRLPAATVGDLVGVFQSGAYARTSSPLGFLSHPAPPEVLVSQGKCQLIRRRGNYADFLADQPHVGIAPGLLSE